MCIFRHVVGRQQFRGWAVCLYETLIFAIAAAKPLLAVIRDGMALLDPAYEALSNDIKALTEKVRKFDAIVGNEPLASN